MKDLDKQIDRLIETLLVRPLNTPGAYAETNKLKQAIKQLIVQARLDEAKLFNRYFDDNLAFKGFAEERIAELQGDANATKS